MGLDALADGHDDEVRGQTHLGHVRRVGRRTSGAVKGPDDLGLGPQGHGPAFLVGFDAHRGLEGQQLGTLGLGALHLLGQGGHILLAAAVDAEHPVRTQADGAAGHVHGHVAAADDHHSLAGKVGQVPVADASEQLHSGHDTLAVLALDAGLLVRMGANGQIQAVIAGLELFKGDVRAHIHIRVDLDAQGQDGSDLRVQLGPGQTVVRDAVAQHTAQLVALFVDRHLVAHEGQVVGRRQSAGAAAHHRHGLAGGLGAGGIGYIAGVVHGEALEGSDVDSVVHHPAPAPGLAGVLADVGAGGGEGVVLADELHRVGVAALADQGDVAGDVHAGGTQRHAGHRVLQTAQAAVAEDVLLIVIPEALNTHQHQPGSLDADGAVGSVYDGLGGALDELHRLHRGLTVQHVLEQLRQLAQTDTAGNAFAAGLGVTEVEEIPGHVDGTKARRAGGNTALHIPVELVYHGLGAAGGLDI